MYPSLDLNSWSLMTYLFLFFYAGMTVYHMHAVVHRDKKGAQDSGNWSKWWLWSDMWMLGTESSGRRIGALDSWAIFPAPNSYILFLPLFIKHTQGNQDLLKMTPFLIFNNYTSHFRVLAFTKDPAGMQGSYSYIYFHLLMCKMRESQTFGDLCSDIMRMKRTILFFKFHSLFHMVSIMMRATGNAM